MRVYRVRLFFRDYYSYIGIVSARKGQTLQEAIRSHYVSVIGYEVVA